jgi:hypothetical protein
MADFQSDRGTSGSCKHFEYCSAPMCPWDRDVSNTAWFADEEICRLKDVPEWVKRQRKIVKIVVDETAGCFTLPMLERRCIIGKSITGIDPDGTNTEREDAEKAWLDKHPPIKLKTEEERVKLAARARLLKGNPSVIGGSKNSIRSMGNMCRRKKGEIIRQGV